MIKYTTINHDARVHLNLTCNQYCIADSIHKLSTNPSAKVKGWCNASKESLAGFLGDVSRRTVIRYINILRQQGLVERKPGNPKLLKTTSKWYDVVIGWDSYRDKISQSTVTKLHSNCDKTSQDGVTKLHRNGDNVSQPSNSSNDNRNIDKAAPAFVSDLNKALEDRKQELIDEMGKEQMWLEHICRISSKEMGQVLKMIPAWAKENEATSFHGVQHKRNSLKKFVVSSKASGSFQNAEGKKVMTGSMLRAVKSGGENG